MMTGKVTGNLDAVIEIEVVGSNQREKLRLSLIQAFIDAKQNCLDYRAGDYPSGWDWDDLRLARSARGT